jgi:NAD(P)-dependent dehydrogenase (short-subunit alcohol dehydrogenase family)
LSAEVFRVFLSGKRAVVTGGAAGIGYQTAQLLVADGTKVAVLDLEPRRMWWPPMPLRAGGEFNTRIASSP